jgi:hypothetical protein
VPPQKPLSPDINADSGPARFIVPPSRQTLGVREQRGREIKKSFIRENKKRRERSGEKQNKNHIDDDENDNDTSRVGEEFGERLGGSGTTL